ncbi:MAG: hypothetical protein K9K69_11205 [Desulfarculaceae bacterium]|nr:hypothetical protein [Desulfarculaceae bacterium]MCF8072946.1 hypothetical protein [Desulfarculaceae bacterium]MCF8115499.1 hypothetical protein [Desulfarculaceae bacterium]
MDKNVIGYAGMTHLGLNYAAAGASKGFPVVCYDPDPDLIAKLNQGDLPVLEPGLDKLVADNRDRLTFTADPDQLAGCDLLYIAQDIPTDDQGRSDLEPIKGLIAEAASHLGPRGHLCVLCQVPPGFTGALDLGPVPVYYQVETLIFGRAVERALYPERFIVGCPDPSQPLPPVMAEYLESFGCPILPMRFESAELCKIAINCFLVSSVSTTNTLAGLCEKIGADWQEIAPALRLDQRIGPKAYLMPGLGIAGGNLERDLATVCRLGDAHGCEVGVVRSWIKNSYYRRFWALRTLHEVILQNMADPLIAVWGLAYKEDTHSIKNSPSLALIGQLHPFRLQAYDPAVPVEAAGHPSISGGESEMEVLEDADVLVIMTPWKQFKEAVPERIAAKMKGRVVIDPYRVLDAAQCEGAGLEHYSLGIGGR